MTQTRSLLAENKRLLEENNRLRRGRALRPEDMFPWELQEMLAVGRGEAQLLARKLVSASGSEKVAIESCLQWTFSKIEEYEGLLTVSW